MHFTASEPQEVTDIGAVTFLGMFRAVSQTGSFRFRKGQTHGYIALLLAVYCMMVKENYME